MTFNRRPHIGVRGRLRQFSGGAVYLNEHRNYLISIDFIVIVSIDCPEYKGSPYKFVTLTRSRIINLFIKPFSEIQSVILIPSNTGSFINSQSILKQLKFCPIRFTLSIQITVLSICNALVSEECLYVQDEFLSSGSLTSNVGLVSKNISSLVNSSKPIEDFK